VHNEGVTSPLPRPAMTLVALASAAALGLSACSGDGKHAEPSPSPSRSPSPSSTVAVPPGVRLTEEGARLPFGRPASVVFEPRRNRGTVLQINVRRVERGTLADFRGFILDDPYKRRAAYYYATVSVRNLGRGDVGGRPVPLWGVDGADTLLPPVSFTTRFARCPSQPLPRRFPSGASLTTCLVLLSPNRGALRALSYRPSQRYDPVTWTGAVTRPAPRASAPAKKPKRSKHPTR
jgi:hypothetical protein